MVLAARWLARPSAPDGFDAYGFVLAIGDRFDLASFQPQFPGYPIVVALGKALHALGLDALSAATAVSALASAVAAVALAYCALKLAGPAAAWGVAALHLFAFQPAFLGSAALSDAAGLAFAACAFAALLAGRAALSGVFAGLMLGARASYFPLALSLLILARRPRLAVAMGVATVAWAAPFAWIAGPRELWSLGKIHLRGHFESWGGSVATRPDLRERLLALVRGLFFDGVAPAWWALGAAGLIAAVALWRAPSAVKAMPFLVALVPYAVWVFVGQNLIEQPRHLLPLIEGGLLLLACALAPQPAALAAISLAVAAASVPLLRERLRVLPAAAQAARWVAQRADAATTFVAAGRSARYFRDEAGAAQVQQHYGLGDLSVSLSRMTTFPHTILVTSEIDLGKPVPPRWRVTPEAAFCRDARIDRAQPCLSLSKLEWAGR